MLSPWRCFQFAYLTGYKGIENRSTTHSLWNPFPNFKSPVMVPKGDLSKASSHPSKILNPFATSTLLAPSDVLATEGASAGRLGYVCPAPRNAHRQGIHHTFLADIAIFPKVALEWDVPDSGQPGGGRIRMVVCIFLAQFSNYRWLWYQWSFFWGGQVTDIFL